MIRPVKSDTQCYPLSQHVFRMLRVIGTMTLIGGLLSGCVSNEKYEAEKARALNFQRLLAQEEKRTGEVNVKFQEAQRELGTLQSDTRDLTAELDAMRDQFTSTQEELTRLREGKLETKSDELTLSEPSISEFGLEDIEFKDSDFADISADLGGDTGDSMAASMSSLSTGVSDAHTVARGDTLFSISRRYDITVADLKSWNNLSGNLIQPGQKLIVTRP